MWIIAHVLSIEVVEKTLVENMNTLEIQFV
jgi:hypothetical protein